MPRAGRRYAGQHHAELCKCLRRLDHGVRSAQRPVVADEDLLRHGAAGKRASEPHSRAVRQKAAAAEGPRQEGRMEKVQHPRGRFGTDRGRHSHRPEVRTVEHDGKHPPVRHLSDGIRSAGAARHRQRDPQCDRGTGRFGRHHAGQACARHPRGWHERTVLRQGQHCGRAHCRHDQSRHGHHVQADADRGKQGRDHAEKA